MLDNSEREPVWTIIVRNEDLGKTIWSFWGDFAYFEDAFSSQVVSVALSPNVSGKLYE